MRIHNLLLMACAMMGFTTGVSAQEASRRDVAVTHDVAVYEKVTRDGLGRNPILWYIGTKGDAVWQTTANFEATEAVALKLGHNLKLGKAVITPHGGVVVGRSNYAMVENWVFVPLGRKVTYLNLSQGLKGIGGPADYAYTFNQVFVPVAPKVKVSALSQHTWTRGDKPIHEVGAGVEIALPNGMYVPIQGFKPLGGTFKVLVGFGVRK